VCLFYRVGDLVLDHLDAALSIVRLVPWTMYLDPDSPYFFAPERLWRPWPRVRWRRWATPQETRHHAGRVHRAESFEGDPTQERDWWVARQVKKAPRIADYRVGHT
jgi:hypothetical protein